MRIVVCAVLAALVVPLVGVGRADDQEAVKVRVRVALALAKAAAAKPPATAAADCGGVCRTDVDAVWKEAADKGAVILMFVGGCKGRAAEFKADDVMPVRAVKYDADGPGEPSRCRVVILARNHPGGAVAVVKTLAFDAPPAEVKAAIAAARVKANTVSQAGPSPGIGATAAAMALAYGTPRFGPTGLAPTCANGVCTTPTR